MFCDLEVGGGTVFQVIGGSHLQVVSVKKKKLVSNLLDCSRNVDPQTLFSVSDMM